MGPDSAEVKLLHCAILRAQGSIPGGKGLEGPKSREIGWKGPLRPI
jgi:hypothetical protein